MEKSIYINRDFLALCKLVGRKSKKEIPINIENNIKEGFVYQHGGLIQFYNGDYLYVTKASKFAIDYLKGIGYKMAEYGNYPVFTINHIYINQYIYNAINTLSKNNYNYNQIITFLKNDQELRIMLAINNDPYLSSAKSGYNPSDILKGLKEYSEYFNNEKYPQTFYKIVVPNVDTYFQNLQNQNTTNNHSI